MSVPPPRRRKTFLQPERVETDWAGVRFLLLASYEARRVSSLASEAFTLLRMTKFVASPPKLHGLTSGGG